MKLGVIGWGLRKHLAKVAHRPEAGQALVALADPAESAQTDFKAFAGADAKVTADYRELPSLGVDAVFVLSPDWLHEEHALFLLEAGIPTYLEKPMAITIEGCDRILAAADRTGTPLFLGHNMRYFGVVRQMREWIQSGKIGRPKAAWCRHFVSYGGEAYFKDWHADRSKSTGMLLQKGAHDIDILHWLAEGYSQRVTALGALQVYGDIQDRQQPGERHPIAFTDAWPPRSLTNLYPIVDIEDTSMMLMELDNGVLASYQQCMFAPDAWRNYTIIGDEGRIENLGDAPGKAVVKLWNRRHHGYVPDADDSIAIPEADGPHGGADALIVDEFLRFVQHGGETTTTPLAGRMAVAAGVAATQSLRDGGSPVLIPAVGWSAH